MHHCKPARSSSASDSVAASSSRLSSAGPSRLARYMRVGNSASICVVVLDIAELAVPCHATAAAAIDNTVYTNIFSWYILCGRNDVLCQRQGDRRSGATAGQAQRQNADRD